MQQNYPIYCDKTQVGTALTEIQGLYACVTCQCNLKKDGLYRVLLKCGQTSHNLGTCLKKADAYWIRTRIPKKLLIEAPEFILLQNDDKAEDFYPIVPGQPFPQLDKLTKGRFTYRDTVAGLTVAE